jgi:hypothetical protein
MVWKVKITEPKVLFKIMSRWSKERWEDMFTPKD